MPSWSAMQLQSDRDAYLKKKAEAKQKAAQAEAQYVPVDQRKLPSPIKRNPELEELLISRNKKDRKVGPHLLHEHVGCITSTLVKNLKMDGNKTSTVPLTNQLSQSRVFNYLLARSCGSQLDTCAGVCWECWGTRTRGIAAHSSPRSVSGFE